MKSQANGLTLAGLFASPQYQPPKTIVSIPWYMTTREIPANFRSLYNPNPRLNVLSNMVAPTIVLKE